jgi:hypothetical protein
LYLAVVAVTCLAIAGGALAQDKEEGRGGRKGPERKSWLERYDTDGDGKVTLQEYTDATVAMAEKRFKAMDANGDGELTEEELRQRQREFRQRWGGRRPGRGDKGRKREEAETMEAE